jgi:hypothetical protein
VLLLSACGATWHATFAENGIGKDQYWVVHAKGKPKAVIVFTTKQIHATVIHSNGFTADHMSVYDLSPPAKHAIWDRVDRLIEQAIATSHDK